MVQVPYALPLLVSPVQSGLVGHLVSKAVALVVRYQVLDSGVDRPRLLPRLEIGFLDETGVVLFLPPLPEADLSVGRAGEGENEVRGLLGVLNGDELLAVDFLNVNVLLAQVLFVELLAVEHDAVEAVLGLLQRSDRGIHLVDVSEVPLDAL